MSRTTLPERIIAFDFTPQERAASGYSTELEGCRSYWKKNMGWDTSKPVIEDWGYSMRE
jgi:hypothetical protein